MPPAERLLAALGTPPPAAHAEVARRLQAHVKGLEDRVWVADERRAVRVSYWQVRRLWWCIQREFSDE